MRSITPSRNSRTGGTRIIDGRINYSSTSRGFQEYISGIEWNRRYGSNIADRARRINNTYNDFDFIIRDDSILIKSQSNPRVFNNGQVFERFHRVTINEDNRGVFLICSCEWFRGNGNGDCKHVSFVEDYLLDI